MKKKILLMVPMLHQGGFERVCVRTARMLQEKCEVSILIFNDADLAFDVEGLDIINIDIKSAEGSFHKLWNILRRVRAVKKVKKEKKIDITYSFGITANLVNVFAKAGDQCWVGLRGFTDLYSKTLSVICKRADKILCCSKTIEDIIKNKFQGKDTVNIPNSYDIEALNQQAKEELTLEEEKMFLHDKTVICVGREDDVKGFWHVIRSFQKVVQEIPEAKLLFVGEGEFLSDKQFVRELGLEDQVYFTGVRVNPFPYLKKSKVFVLSSSNEGFPNVLVEAMALGVPVIATNCQSGPAEILMKDDKEALDNKKLYQGDYGILVPILNPIKDLKSHVLEDTEMILADQIIAMLLNLEKHDKYHKLAMERAQYYSDEKYKEMMLKLIDEQ